MLPPGRARLSTKPVPTGSDAAPNTIGMTVVACFAARVAGVATVTMKSTLQRIPLRFEHSLHGERSSCTLLPRALASDLRALLLRSVQSFLADVAPVEEPPNRTTAARDSPLPNRRNVPLTIPQARALRI